MVAVLDTTLREGEQTPGVYFDTHIKLAIAEILDRIRVQYIEAGHPFVSREIRQGVERIAHAGFDARIGAHSRSLIKDVDMAVGCGVGFLGVFYCVSDGRLNGVFGRSLTAALDQIASVIAYAREKSPQLLIRYTPEDTVRSEFGNVVEASAAAVRAGADVISIADTTGCMVPGTKRSMFDYVTRLREALDARGVHPLLAVHCHNDRGLALANALDAYRAGVDIIDASVLGLGERAGVVDLAQLLATLAADFGESGWNLKPLPELYRLVSRRSGVPVPVNYPVTGRNAFTHCAGVHTHAAMKNPMHYESLDPALVGRRRKYSLDHMSGLSSVAHALKEIGEPEELAGDLLPTIKAVGRSGRVVELEELRYIVASCRRTLLQAR